MAHYGRSEEEMALRGEEHTFSARADTPGPDIPSFPKAREKAEAVKLEPIAAIKKTMPELPSDDQGDLLRRLFREGVEIMPGLEAKLDVGRKNLIRFTHRF